MNKTLLLIIIPSFLLASDETGNRVMISGVPGTSAQQTEQSSEGYFSLIVRKVGTATRGQATQFCSEIDSRYYDTNQVDALDIEHRGERALAEALNLRNVEQVCKIVEFFKGRDKILKLNEKHSDAASKFLRDQVKKFLELIKYTDQRKPASISAIQNIESAWKAMDTNQ